MNMPAPSATVRVYRLTPEIDDTFDVEQAPDGSYQVRGKRVERLVAGH